MPEAHTDAGERYCSGGCAPWRARVSLLLVGRKGFPWSVNHLRGDSE